MQVIILCGGKGTRLREETENKPKPLVEVGGKPILWHIMKIYSHYGFNDFVLCLGYKGDMIKDYFVNHSSSESDFTFDSKTKECLSHGPNSIENWTITFANTGQETLTAARIKQVEKYITEDTFHVTYGDVIADIDISALVRQHNEVGTIGVMTGIHGRLKRETIKAKGSIITEFKQELEIDDIVNGGFMVFKKEFFTYLTKNCMLEETLSDLVKDRQLGLYYHGGFWENMNTYQEVEKLNKLCEAGTPPWYIWEKGKKMNCPTAEELEDT